MVIINYIWFLNTERFGDQAALKKPSEVNTHENSADGAFQLRKERILFH